MSGTSMFEGTEEGGVLAPEPAGPVRRALVMAGGGLKVAFQAGVLQVWLDEAREHGKPLAFAHGDGASGGVYNLAMWVQGMSGRRIADNWRRFSPVRHGFGLDWRGWLRGRAVFTMNAFRRKAMRGLWGLDWARIQASGRSAGFNVFDVDEQRLVTVPPAAMTEDHLVAATSLPFWYPPVMIRGRRYIDAVYNTDANLDAAIRSGANELWIVWTVSTAGRWRGGPVAQYFQVIEAAANGRLRSDLDRIARSNRAHVEGTPAEYPHPVRVRALHHEVDMHYLFTFTRKRIATAVEQGVAAARVWCAERGFPIEPSRATGGEPVAPVAFHELMSGPVSFGTAEPDVAAQLGAARGETMTLDLDVAIDDLTAFRADPAHLGRVSGSVTAPVLGGTFPVSAGTVALLPERADEPRRGTTMEYRLRLADGTGRPLEIVGVKTVRDDPGPDLWSDTTTLAVHVRTGSGSGGTDHSVLSGVLRMTPLSFLRVAASLQGLAVPLFAIFFLRRLAQLYLGPAVRGPRQPDTVALPGWPAGEGPTGAEVFVHNERVLPAPPERVMAALLHAKGWSAYYPNAWFVRVADRPDGTLTAGTVFRWVTFGLPIVSTVTEFDPEAGVLGWTWHGFGARGHHLWSLRPDPSGTRVVTQETQRGVLPRLFAPLLRRVVPAGHDRWLRGLGEVTAWPA